MRSVLKGILCCSGLCLSVPLSVSATPGAAIPDDVTKNIRERVDNGFSPGIVLGLVDHDQTSYFSYGKLSRSSKRKVDKNTIFEIGSITKVFTSLLLADMVERGKVGLDDPIQKYLPDNVHVPSRNGKQITLKNLTTHRSGLPRMPTNWDMTKTGNPYAGYTQDKLYAFLNSYELENDIDAAYAYSNLGGGLLGHILSRISGKQYEPLVIEKICKPLGMDDTRIKLSRSERKRFAKGYQGGKEVGNWNFDCLAGCGALRSSAKDLIALVTAEMGLKKTNPGLLAAMQKTQQGRIETGDSHLKVALGWHVWTRYGTEIIWHNGGTGGYHAFCGFIPEKKVGVVVLSNSTDDIDDIGLHTLEPQFALKSVRKTTTVPSSILEGYVGYYELVPGVVFHITKKSDALFAQLTGQDSYQIYPESETKFFYKVVDAQISFVKDKEGKTTSLTLHQGGFDRPARKLGPEYQPPPERVEVPVDEKTLQSYVGEYQLTPVVRFYVTLDEGKLMVRITGQSQVQVFPESQTKFFYKVVDAQITFTKDSDGKVTGLTLHQFGRDQTAQKVK